MPDFHIRTASAHDVLLLVQLNETVQALHVAENPLRYKSRGQDEAARAAYFAGHIADADSVVFIAEAAGHPVGYVLCIVNVQVEGPFTKATSSLEIDQLSVEQDWQRRGVASALMARVERFACERGITRLTLSVAAFNVSALAFYESLGYEIAMLRLARPVRSTGERWRPPTASHPGSSRSSNGWPLG